MGYIYKIYNDINDKLYIGKTTIDINKRLKEHFYDAKKQKYINRPLYQAINKYGESHFFITIIEECDNDNLNAREKYYIKLYNTYGHNGYNATEGGDGQLKNSELIAQIQTLYERGACAQDIAIHLNLSLVRTQHIISRYHLNATRKNYKANYKIYGVNILTNIQTQIFTSLTDAAQWVSQEGIATSGVQNTLSNIRRSVKNNNRTAYGYKWYLYN